VITVSGAYSGVGKTRVIERLLPILRNATAAKVRTEQTRPATRYEETSGDQNAAKDTGRYLTAGARRAFLLTGPLADALAMAKEILAKAETDVVIFETDSLSAALGPHLAIFVAGDGPWKPAAEERRRQAHIVVTEALAARSRAGSERMEEAGTPEGETKKIAKAVRAEAEDNRIACAKALALARRLGVSPDQVGEACNQARIKIVQCQLGCFR
jgi:molybdopterin-guanine dinucleotide biosynthesis protein